MENRGIQVTARNKPRYMASAEQFQSSLAIQAIPGEAPDITHTQRKHPPLYSPQIPDQQIMTIMEW